MTTRDASPSGSLARRKRDAFSLLELVCVLCVLGVLAASAIPAASTIVEFKVEAVRAEVTSYLEFARETASATGVPSGVRLNASTQEMEYLQIVPPAHAPTTMLDTAGQPRPTVIVDRHGGACLQSVSGAGPAANGSVVWFGHAGVPEHRSADGSLLADAPGDIVISFTSGQPLTVHAFTGIVE